MAEARGQLAKHPHYSKPLKERNRLLASVDVSVVLRVIRSLEKHAYSHSKTKISIHETTADAIRLSSSVWSPVASEVE